MDLSSLLAWIDADLKIDGLRRGATRHLVVHGYTTVASTTFSGVWEPTGIVSYPSRAGQQLELVSASASDDGVNPSASAYVHVVRVHHLEAPDLEYAYEDVTINGLTSVNTDSSLIARILSLQAIKYGVNERAAGRISCRHTVNTPTYDAIPAGAIGSASCRTTVPARFRAYCWRWSVASKLAETAIYQLVDTADDRPSPSEPPQRVPQVRDTALSSDGRAATMELTSPRRLMPGDDVEVQAMRSGAADVLATARIDLVLVETGEEYVG